MPEPIIITNFQTGIADSPHTGFADMRNVIIDKENGVVQINWKTTSILTGGALLTSTPRWIEQDDAADTVARFNTFYILTSEGQLIQSTDSGDTWTSLSNGYNKGEGLKVWKDHIIVAHNTALSAYGPLNTTLNPSTPLWSTSFISLIANNEPNNWIATYNPIITGQDDILYVGDGRYVDSLQEVSGQNFTAGTASTFTWGTAALDLPENYRIKNFSELGVNLFAGTWRGTTADKPQTQIADIFPWDRTSDSFNLPIRLVLNGINWQINIGNLIYFQAGMEGKIYVTNGQTVKFITQVPEHLTGIGEASSSNARIALGAPAGVMYHKGKLFFALLSSTTASEGVLDGIGVWSVDLETGVLIMENQVSTGVTTSSGATTPMLTALKSVNKNQYLIGWQDNSGNPRLDKVSNTQRYTDYAARIDSQYYSVGTKNKPESFSQLEFELTEPLRTGEGIRFFYRTDLRSVFTPIRTFDFATDGAIQGGNTDFLITTEQGIQVRTEMTTGASSTTTISLKSVIIV